MNTNDSCARRATINKHKWKTKPTLLQSPDDRRITPKYWLRFDRNFYFHFEDDLHICDSGKRFSNSNLKFNWYFISKFVTRTLWFNLISLILHLIYRIVQDLECFLEALDLGLLIGHLFLVRDVQVALFSNKSLLLVQRPNYDLINYFDYIIIYNIYIYCRRYKMVEIIKQK